MNVTNGIAFVFARGGSKGLPRKNVLPLAGIPLIGHAVRTALATPGIVRCVISTDDAEIAAVAKEHGAEVPFMRPAALAEDRSAEWLAWRHAITTLRERGETIDLFVSVPAVAPLRLPEDIAACIAAFEPGKTDMVITITETNHNPYFSMVTVDADGATSLAIKPDRPIVGRQMAPKVYNITPVAYVADPDFVLRANGIFEGRVHSVMVPPERAVDIDSALDFKFAELLMAERRASGGGG